MNNNNYIEFKKKRELGDIITDTFAFLRNNFKGLFSVLLKTTGPILILLMLSLGYYVYTTSSMMKPFSLNNESVFPFSSTNIVLPAIIMLLCLVLFYGIFYATILHYIKIYTENNGVIDESIIISGVKKDFGSIIGLALLSTLIMFFGFALCFFPGVYLYVPMSLVFAIFIFRNRGVFDVIGDSFELIKNEWWITFATLLVITIIGYIISMVFSLPFIIYSMFKTFTLASEGSQADPSAMFDWPFILLNSISSVLQYIILFLLSAVSSAFIYFNLNERKHHTGTIEQIDSLGKSE